MIRRMFTFILTFLLAFAVIQGVDCETVVPEKESFKKKWLERHRELHFVERLKSQFEREHKRFKVIWGYMTDVIYMGPRNKPLPKRVKRSLLLNKIISRIPILAKLNPKVGPNKWWKVRFKARRWWFKHRLHVMYVSIFVLLLLISTGILPPIAGLFGASYYLDMDAGSNGDGSQSSPFNNWTSFKNAMQSSGPHDGYIKRGNTLTGNNNIYPSGDGWTIQAYGTGDAPFITAGFGTNNDDWTISDIDIDGTGVTGFSYIIQNDNGQSIWNGTIHDVEVTNTRFMAYNNGGGGFSIHDFTISATGSCMNFEATASNKFGDTDIYNFTIDCNDSTSSDGISIHTDQDGQTGGTGWAIYNGEISNCAENALDLTACGGGQFYQLELHDCSGPLVYVSYRSTGVHLHHSYIYESNNSGIADYSKGPNYYYKNLIKIDASAGNGVFYIADYGGSNKDDGYIEGNTIIIDGGTAFKFTEENGAAITAFHINNNIITTTTSSLSTVYSFSGFTWGEVTAANNIYYNPAGDPQMTPSVNWTTWTGTHTEASKNDPLLVDRAFTTYGDYRDAYLSGTSSPAYGNASYSTTGTYYKRDGTSVTGLASVDDYAGDTGGGDIGFDEYVDAGNPPTVTTQSATSITYQSATLNGNITAIGDSTPTRRGFYVNTSESKTGADDVYETGSFPTGSFSLGTGDTLDPNTTYYCLAYATNTQGESTNNTWESFVTLDYSQSCSLTMSDGDDIILSNGDDWSDINITVGATSTITTNNNSDNVTVGDGTNNGTLGTENHTGTVTGGTWTECGEYLGGFSTLEPASCSGGSSPSGDGTFDMDNINKNNICKGQMNLKSGGY